MGGVAQQETSPIAQALDGTPVHLEIGNPSEIAQPHVDADPGIEHRAQLRRRRRSLRVSASSRLTKMSQRSSGSGETSTNPVGPTLRKAALKLIPAADTGQARGPDLPQTRTQKPNVPDAHARTKKRLDQAGPVENLQHRRLESGPASLAMRRQPALHDARLDAMAKKLTGREQSGRATPHDQDGRRGCGRTILTGIQQPHISPTDGSFVRFEGSVVAAEGLLQWCGAQVLMVYYRRPGGQLQHSSPPKIDPGSDRIRRALSFAREHLSDPQREAWMSEFGWSKRRTRFLVSRRQIMVAAASVVGAGIWAVPASAQGGPYRFKHGDFEITVLSDGHLVLPATIHGLDAPREDVQRLLKDAGLDSDQVKPGANPALIRTGSDLILLDTGSGADFQPTAGKLLNNLAAAGIDPKSVTKVVFTHAHPDHIWGTTGPSGALHFPNAAYYVSAAEWDFWMDPGLATRLPDQMHAFVTGAQTNLAAVRNRITMVKPGDDIVTGISVVASSGHTPGHISLVVTGSEGLLIPADAITEPAVYFPHPEWRFAYDMDNDQAVANRKKLLERAATDKMKMLGFHWPYPGLGFAERKGTAYRYVPVT